MKLTSRQKEVLGKLVALYRESGNSPVHYTTLAQRVGISRWTAYDMMGVLSKKGLVKAKYEVSSAARERGRSSVLFAPTSKARDVLKGMMNYEMKEQSWYRLKQMVLNKLEHVEGDDKETLLRNILALLNKEKPMIRNEKPVRQEKPVMQAVKEEKTIIAIETPEPRPEKTMIMKKLHGYFSRLVKK